MTKNLNYKNEINNLARDAYYFAKQKNLGFASIHNGEVDAFRHIYSSAILTIKYGELAHNLSSYLYEIAHQNPSKEKIMDFYNNQVGQEIGERFSESMGNLNLKNDKDIKNFIAFEVEQSMKNQKAITSLDDERIELTLKNMPDHPFRVYTKEDIDKMPTEEFLRNEKNILKNMANNKILTKAELLRQQEKGVVVYVNSYTKDDGTVVKGYYRSKPSF